MNEQINIYKHIKIKVNISFSLPTGLVCKALPLSLIFQHVYLMQRLSHQKEVMWTLRGTIYQCGK